MQTQTHCLSIQPTYFTVFKRFNKKESKVIPIAPLSNLANKNVSIQAQRKIRRYAELLYSCSTIKNIYSIKEDFTFTYKVGFITLTLPYKQMHSDNYILENVFQRFMKALRYEYKCYLYLWKCEKQSTTNNIHFHVTINQFIHHKEIRSKWCKFLKKCKWYDIELEEETNYIKAYQDLHNTQNLPPCTEIKAVKQSKGFGIYLSKYIAKSNNSARENSVTYPTCKLWDCSMKLKQYKNVLSYDENQETNNIISAYFNDASKLLYSDDYVKVYQLNKRLEDSNTIAAQQFKQSIKPLIDYAEQTNSIKIESIYSNI